MLFDEMVSRIKKNDRTVPYLMNGYYYYSRYEKGKEYAIYCRKKGSLDSNEEIILDANELSKGHDYFSLGGRVISPNNKLLSYKVNLPKKIYPGIYKIKMTLIDQEGIELSKSEQSVKVSKVGIQEFLSTNSKNNPVFYGLFSVIIALFLGFSAAQLFRWLYR